MQSFPGVAISFPSRFAYTCKQQTGSFYHSQHSMNLRIPATRLTPATEWATLALASHYPFSSRSFNLIANSIVTAVSISSL